MSSLFSSPKIPAPQPLPEPPSVTDPAVEEARRKELAAASARQGRRATLLTGGDGVAEPASLGGRTRLLGG